MSDSLDILCPHGREIRCLECAAEYAEEIKPKRAAAPPPSGPLTRYRLATRLGPSDLAILVAEGDDYVQSSRRTADVVGEVYLAADVDPLIDHWRSHYDAAVLNWNEVLRERDELERALAAKDAEIAALLHSPAKERS